MKNNGLFSTLFIEKVGKEIGLDDLARGRMATLMHSWRTHEAKSADGLWETFMKQALGYLQFVPGPSRPSPGVYLLYEDFSFSNCISVLFLTDPSADINDTTVGRFWPAKLTLQLNEHKLNWGILTNGATWRLYSTKSSRPHEDFMELSLAEALESNNELEYALFERFFHRDSFVPEESEKVKQDEAAGVYKCRLDRDGETSEDILEKHVKRPLLYQVDEILQYLCNGFIADTPKSGEEYTEDERREIFESAVKLLYRCLFFFYAEARRLLPSEREKAEAYEKHSIHALCREAHKFQWGKRKDFDGYGLWQHLKGLTSAVNDGDPEYGIMGYNGGLFDDKEENFLGEHKLRNDFLSRVLYLLAYVEPQNGNPEDEYEIPYMDLEVRHLGELYENILEFNVVIADAPLNRWMTKKGPVLRLESDGKPEQDARLIKQIKKGDVFFAQTALERKQTGSYYTSEPLVRFLNERAVIDPLREKFDRDYRKRLNEFIEQACSGYDEATRRGAGCSAVALIERFVSEEILNFKVCDPAMGSGHFLVDTANQISGLVVEFLAEIPDIEGMAIKAKSEPNYWRRLITRHCLYGVDFNPLAVNLARLSLWLNCFAIDHRLTFIDPHLCCGNSLVGMRTLDQLKEIPKRKKDNKKKEKQQLKFDFDDITKILSEAAHTLKSITEIHEDDTDRQKVLFDGAIEKTEMKLTPLANLFTAYLMDSSIREEEYLDLFNHLAKGGTASGLNRPDLVQVWNRVKTYNQGHKFFHWVLAFPDVFNEDKKGGFDTTVGNPPWDVVIPSSIEFFLNYEPEFRTYKKQEAKRIIARMVEKNPIIREKWNDYWDYFEEQRIFFRESTQFMAQGKGDLNTFKLFLEQFFNIIGASGHLSIVVPSGIYTDHGCQPLRRLFFTKSRIRCLYSFENRWPTVFGSVDGRFKFVAFSTQKGGQTVSFKCAFMKHDPERLPAIDANALEIMVADIKRFSPGSLNLIEFSSQKEMHITSKLYEGKPSFGDYLRRNWNTSFQREFHMTGDSGRYITKIEDRDTERNLLPLWEGKHFWILTDSIGCHRNWMTSLDASAKRTTRFTRVIYRALAASTNERTFIPTVLPEPFPTGHTVNVCPLPRREAVTIASLTSSFVWDWIVRGKVTTSISIFILDPLPFVDYRAKQNTHDTVAEVILARGCRLLCTSEIYRKIWEDCFSERWTSREFWYPISGSVDYGPREEQEIRRRLADEARMLSREWAPHYAVYQCSADRRDTGDRAQLRAEIDAYVAHLYGLNREDFSYILDTFPVLKRKEQQVFGEFMSKRKCLEEYDRIASIL